MEERKGKCSYGHAEKQLKLSMEVTSTSHLLHQGSIPILGLLACAFLGAR